MSQKIFVFSLLLSSSFIALAFLDHLSFDSGSRIQKNYADSVEKNYQLFCSGCHGEKMDAFVDRNWKHGNSKEDLFRAIKFGYPDEGMPSFDSAFSNDAIQQLSEYIISGIEKVKQYQFTDTPKSNYFPSTFLDIKLDTIVKGLKVPWCIAFLPQGGLIVTERSGKLYKCIGKKKPIEIDGTPAVLAQGQGGLLDVILHPNFKQNKILYLSYSALKTTDSALLSTTAIMRARLEGTHLKDQKTIFEALPYSKTRHHYGGRMAWGKDGKLYISVGERGNEKENPQSLFNDLGKIHRINEDGSIPKDNPFINTKGARASIYSYGHRNPQGLLLNKHTGQIWSHEHGPRGGDELNIIKKGSNYGWPLATYGINYNGKIISDKSILPGIEQPILYWIPSIAPSGICFVEGNRYPGWENQLLIGSLRFKYLDLCRVKDDKIISQEMLFKNVGRLRDVRMGPDGFLYMSVENPGYIFKLIPEKINHPSPGLKKAGQKSVKRK